MGGATAGRPVLVVERTSERRCPNMLPITRHLPSTTFTMTTVQKIKVRLYLLFNRDAHSSFALS